MKIDPFLQKQSKSQKDLINELDKERVKKQDLNLPCLGNLIARKMSSMSPYTIPKSAGIFKSLADVINRKHFKGVYPESFSIVPEYFRNMGISPYYEVVPGNDYSSGVLTINTMIELTAGGYKWQLDREQDIGLIISIAEAYQEQLKKMLRPDSNRTEDIRNQAYADKLDKFLKVMHMQARKMLYRNRTDVKIYSLAEIMDLFDSIGD